MLKGQEQKATSDAKSLGLGSSNDAEELQKNASAKTVPPGSIPVSTGYIPVPTGAITVSTDDVPVHTSSLTDSFFDDEPTTRFPCPSDLVNHDPSPGIFSYSSYDDESGAALNNVASTMEVTMKKIFKYLKGQPKLGFWYPKKPPLVLEAYSDSDYAGENKDRKSTTSGCQFLGRRLISWQCKKQTIMATSSTEAEYVAAANCRGQVLWIQNQLLDYGLMVQDGGLVLFKCSTWTRWPYFDDKVFILVVQVFPLVFPAFLLVLFDSHDGGKGSCVWQHQQLWEIRSWRLYTLSNVHVLETVSGEVLSMFADVSYHLSVKLMEKMLRHKLEIDKDAVGNDMTTVEQLIQFIKNQLAAAQVSSV
nr:uncharacterized mitochondrial protein AtMg00810-like [Tanacetum cinerariifolium]